MLTDYESWQDEGCMAFKSKNKIASTRYKSCPSEQKSELMRIRNDIKTNLMIVLEHARDSIYFHTDMLKSVTKSNLQFVDYSIHCEKKITMFAVINHNFHERMCIKRSHRDKVLLSFVM